MAYHEWLSIKRNEYISCLNWIAGGSFIAGMIYFIIDSNIFPEIKFVLIDTVAAHSTALLTIFRLPVYRTGHTIFYNNVPITIIFACTAIQAAVLFIGMIGALNNINVKRRISALLITVVPIYFLNLVRNASVIYLVGGKITSFHIAHNVLSKIGALITLIALLFLVFRLLPELYDEIMYIFNLVKRNGPIENLFSNYLGKKEK
jgi:archaeosortase A (PGF-CTERM-specific)